jgi:hypothetical protein
MQTTVQEVLPGAFLPPHAVTSAAAAICAIPSSDGTPCTDCTRTAAEALAAGLAAIDPTLTDPGHVLVVGEDRWTLQHPLACRPNHSDCATHAEVDAELDDACLLDVGSYRVEVRDGVLLVDGTPLHDDQEDEDSQR